MPSKEPRTATAQSKPKYISPVALVVAIIANPAKRAIEVDIIADAVVSKPLSEAKALDAPSFFSLRKA